MRHSFVFVLLLLGCAACSKKEPEPAKEEIVLNQPVLQGDSLVLTWSKPANGDQTRYWISRGTTPNGVLYDISQNGDGYAPLITATRYVDKTAAYCPYLTYTVRGVGPDGLVTVVSNSVTFERPGLKTIHAQPFDVQFDAQRRLLYFFGKTGVITQYSLTTSEVTKTIATASIIGYSDRATYNGVPELYVPRQDGSVFVYNAETLAKIDEISVGASASSVVANQGLLFVSVDDKTGHPLKVYSRATKQQVGEASGRKITRLRMLPNSNTKLVAITEDNGAGGRLTTDLQYFTFLANGLPTPNAAIPYDGSQVLSTGIFEVCPANNTFITSREGTIYKENLQFEAKLLRGNINYTSFAFDPTGRFIYGGAATRSPSWTQSVEVYDAASHTLSRIIPTKAYPFRLFADGANGIIAVGSITVVAYKDNGMNRAEPVTDLVVEYLR
ncbi:hypothetical protein [Hymenobacter ruricola]|uniref:Fibronectin type-III domain-containing protein n=1 Tax=Hymenobacter ruricola TaxID=2791023 RepID=A0ABS0I902_9BACT|nr:hypothetical protein [Hymenobacter ruricola]MBF9223052.1 hypothetical protein [Hymenobacter ruricola]